MRCTNCSKVALEAPSQPAAQNELHHELDGEISSWPSSRSPPQIHHDDDISIRLPVMVVDLDASAAVE